MCVPVFTTRQPIKWKQAKKQKQEKKFFYCEIFFLVFFAKTSPNWRAENSTTNKQTLEPLRPQVTNETKPEIYELRTAVFCFEIVRLISLLFCCYFASKSS